jgi:hypothetical protein
MTVCVNLYVSNLWTRIYVLSITKAGADEATAVVVVTHSGRFGVQMYSLSGKLPNKVIIQILAPRSQHMTKYPLEPSS